MIGLVVILGLVIAFLLGALIWVTTRPRKDTDWAHCHDCPSAWAGPDGGYNARAHRSATGHFVAHHNTRITLSCDATSWERS